MTKNKEELATKVEGRPDPRAKYTADDRRAQFALSMKLYHQLGEMTYAVDRINTVRLALDERASNLPPGDLLAKRLRAASARADEFRKKIVATKEGGMITGEERLREYLADLYGNLVSYDGRPSQTQVERADALARELAEVVEGFNAWTAKELIGLNSAIAEKQLHPYKPLTREDWEKRGGRK